MDWNNPGILRRTAIATVLNWGLQAQSGRWTVVGLVTWGIGCATDVPGVYAKLSYFRNWINAN